MNPRPQPGRQRFSRKARRQRHSLIKKISDPPSTREQRKLATVERDTKQRRIVRTMAQRNATQYISLLVAFSDIIKTPLQSGGFMQWRCHSFVYANYAIFFFFIFFLSLFHIATIPHKSLL